MATNPEPGRRIQFSLRTFLIASCVLGVAGGMLGRLFVRNPEVFLLLLGAFSTVLPFLLAISTILWIGWHSPRRRWALIVWGGVLLLMPPVGMGVLYFVESFIHPSPGNLQFQSTQQLIQWLPTRVDQPWVWNELTTRLKAGGLTQQEVDDAVKQLISHMTAKRPNGWDQPLHWQGDFVKSATQAGKVSEPLLLALCDAFHGKKPVIPPLPRIREGKQGLSIEVQYGNRWSDEAQFGLELLWQADRVLLDGKPLDVRQTSKTNNDWTCYHDGRLPAGDHEITVELECAYVDQRRLLGLSARNLHKSRWPEASKRWKQSVSATLKVHPHDTPLVALTTDPSQDPGSTGGARIDRLVVQADQNGKKKLVLKAELPFAQSTLSYDVAVSLNGQLIPLGPFWIVQSGHYTSRNGCHPLEARLDTLDPSITQADIHLTPNPRHVEQYPEVSEIWGKKTVLRAVPLERLDLKQKPVGQRP
jgi:hypothetical protein